MAMIELSAPLRDTLKRLGELEANALWGDLMAESG